MKIYSVVKTTVTNMSEPDVEVTNFTDEEKAQSFFNEKKEEINFEDDEYFVTNECENGFEAYLEEDPLMDFSSVRLIETETE